MREKYLPFQKAVRMANPLGKLNDQGRSSSYPTLLCGVSPPVRRGRRTEVQTVSKMRVQIPEGSYPWRKHQFHTYHCRRARPGSRRVFHPLRSHTWWKTGQRSCSQSHTGTWQLSQVWSPSQSLSHSLCFQGQNRLPVVSLGKTWM